MYKRTSSPNPCEFERAVIQFEENPTFWCIWQHMSANNIVKRQCEILKQDVANLSNTVSSGNNDFLPIDLYHYLKELKDLAGCWYWTHGFQL